LPINRITKASLMCGVIISATCLQAEPAGRSLPTFEITPFGGYRLGGSLGLDDPSYKELKFGDGGIYGVALGLDVPVEDVGDGMMEFMWTHVDSTLTAQPNPGIAGISTDMKVDQFHLNGLYLPPGNIRFRPYAIVGLGATRFAPTGALSSATMFSWALGAGAKVALTNRFGLRFEAKWDPALANSSGSVFCNSATGQCFVTASGDTINQFDFTAGLTLRL
jgi:opacity protein-like surface antigen